MVAFYEFIVKHVERIRAVDKSKRGSIIVTALTLTMSSRIIYQIEKIYMHVTLKDVARRAGVSPKTVSRVVNQQGEISPQTRSRVQTAIQELGYRPNILARNLVNQRSNTIAIVASGIEYFGPMRTVLGIEQQTNAFGYSLSLNLVHDPANPNAPRILDELIARRVDGIIWAVPEIGNNRTWLQNSWPTHFPPIVYLSMATHPNLPILAVDNRHGARLATRHLIERGRRRIGCITGPLSWWEARERLAGWRETLTEADLNADAALVSEGNWTPASGENAMRALLALDPIPDAIFCSNDQMALGALGELHRTGLRAPDDIAIVGFDNIPESEFFLPPLTTIHQPLIELGRAAVQELHAHIEEQRTTNEQRKPETALLEPTLVTRNSS